MDRDRGWDGALTVSPAGGGVSGVGGEEGGDKDGGPRVTCTYSEFIARKSQQASMDGFEPIWMPDFLFDFQRHLVEWAIRKGRAAIFADCGLGKTPMQLVWAENVRRHTNKPVLILTPLAVSAQTVREAEKFSIDCQQSRDGKVMPNITVTNYERLHYFDSSSFAGVVCDESSILKNFDGVRRKSITQFLKKMTYRLLCTATAAPNDFIELGTSSEAIGQLGHMDMLARFFKNDDKSLFLHGQKYGDMTQKNWRFKAHAEEGFWRWVCSWARACRKPSDLGFDDTRFVLPDLITREHEVKARSLPDGFLFDIGARTLQEQREEQRRTIQERCEAAAELVKHNGQCLVWCHLNQEAEMLRVMIPDCREIGGTHSDEEKQEAFETFVAGGFRVLITKPKVACLGLNFQNCAHQTFFPSHSFEQWYQGVRRSWRFGQKKSVTVDIITTEGAEGVLASLKRKTESANRMFDRLVSLMHRFQSLSRTAYGETPTENPSWL